MKNVFSAIFAVVFVVFLGLCPEHAAGDDGPADADAPAGAESSPADDSEHSASSDKPLLRDIEEVLSHLEKGGALRDISAKQRRAVLEAVLAELGYASPSVPGARETEGDEESDPRSSAKRILTLHDWCLYLRISRLDADTATAVAEELRTKERRSVRWTILDVRRLENDVDIGEKAVVDMVAAFESRKAPLVVLAGRGAQKGTRRLVERLRTKSPVVTIGDPNAGHAYETKELSLPSGIKVNVPDFSDDSASSGQQVLSPDITVPYSGRGLDADVFEQEDEALRQALLRDPTIRHALDTLIAARAFAEPHF